MLVFCFKDTIFRKIKNIYLFSSCLRFLTEPEPKLEKGNVRNISLEKYCSEKFQKISRDLFVMECAFEKFLLLNRFLNRCFPRHSSDQLLSRITMAIPLLWFLLLLRVFVRV